MQYNELVKYFELYVEQFGPYQSDELYNSISQYLKDYYFKDSYCNIPYQFKLLWEKSIIDNVMYDTMLSSVGYPLKLLQGLTTTEKETLLLSMYDYRTYSHTIYFLKKTASLFNNSVNVYELYLDYKNGEWCFIPKIVYLQEQQNYSDILNYRLSFDYVYAHGKKFYITKRDLQQLYNNGEIILPFKTNLLLLDYYLTYDHNTIMDQVIRQAILSEYYYATLEIIPPSLSTSPISITNLVCDDNLTSNNNSFFITHESSSIPITLIGWFQLYYYVFYRYYNETFYITPFLQLPIQFPSPNYEYTLSDIISLEQQYYDIETSLDATHFFNDAIRSKFLRIVNLNKEQDIHDLETILRDATSPVPVELMDYIDILFSSSYNLQSDVMAFLDTLDRALETFIYSITNETHKEYLKNLLNSMPTITIDIPKTATHLLISEFKPFHTQLLDFSHVKVISDDMLNTVTPAVTSSYALTSDKTTVYPISDKTQQSLSIISDDAEDLITTSGEFDINYLQIDNSSIADETGFVLSQIQPIYVSDNDSYSFRVMPKLETNLGIFTSQDFRLNTSITDNVQLSDEFNIIVND